MSRLARGLALFIVVSAVAASTAGAQGAPTQAGTCRLEELSDSYTVDTLILVLDPGYGIKPVDSEKALMALAVVSDDLTLPAPLVLPPVIVKSYLAEPGDTVTMAAGAQGFMAEAFVELAATGTVKRVGLSQTSMVGAIDVALVEAMEKAAGEGAFMAYSEKARSSGGYVFVQLRTMPVPDFVEKAKDYTRPTSPFTPLPYGNDERLKAKGSSVTVPIRALRIPLVRLTAGAAITRRGPDPRFPHTETMDRQDGFVNVEYVVGADGRLVPGTLRIANAMTRGYANAVTDALQKYRFRPAMAGDCPIAARMAYTYTFEIF